MDLMRNSEVDQQVAELKVRADSIRSRFDENARRPVVIEFAGMPKAGKTTIVNEIHRFLKRCGFRAKIITEKAAICAIRDKKDMSFNVWTVFQTLSELLVDTQSPPSGADPEVVIVDRGLFDAVSWFRLLERLKRVHRVDRIELEKLVLLSEWRERISQVFVLTVSPQEAMAREQGLIPISVFGSIMNVEVLAQTKENALRCARELETHFNIKAIDTTGRIAADIARRVAEMVLDTIDAHLDEKILSVDIRAIEDVFHGRTILDASVDSRMADRLSNTFAKGNFASRERVEIDPSRIQALPVLVVRNSKGDLLQLRRKERDRNNSLHNKVVLWAGGHVREEDGSNGRAVMHCLLREAKEELKLNISDKEPRFLGAVWDRHATPKTAQHVALVYEWRAQSEDVEVCLSNAEFYERRGTSLSGKFVPVSDLLKARIDEPWSSAILASLLPDGSETIQKRLL